MTFQETLQVHLAAIEQRNLPEFLHTMTQANAFCCILPNGKKIDDPQEFREFMQGWFADPDWQISFRLLQTFETEQMSIALLDVHYDDKDQNGAPYQLDYYLSLGFAQKNGEWRLVFDQNTIHKNT